MLDRLVEARVLVIDDDPDTVSLLQSSLFRAGFKFIFTETDPRRVLAILPDVDPDVVVLALHMVELDGFQVLAQIRQFAPGEYLPVLILTVDITATAAERALREGAQDFVSKPFSAAEVLLRLQNLLDNRFVRTTLRSSVVLARERTREGRQLSRALVIQRNRVEKLEDLDGLKDMLLQTVSHDLRSPISVVLLLTSLLADDAKGTRPLATDRKLEILAHIEDTTEKMGILLTDLLDSDPMRRNDDAHESYDVGELVKRVLASADVAASHPVETELACVMTDVDPVHVERMVENLLTNAVNHVPAGVQVWVRTAKAPGGALISVEDAGPGIKPESAASIFQLERTADGVDNRGRMSLGLSLVLRFAQLHGGDAWLEQRPGGGCAFKIFLPQSVSERRPAVSSGVD